MSQRAGNTIFTFWTSRHEGFYLPPMVVCKASSMCPRRVIWCVVHSPTPKRTIPSKGTQASFDRLGYKQPFGNAPSCRCGFFEGTLFGLVLLGQPRSRPSFGGALIVDTSSYVAFKECDFWAYPNPWVSCSSSSLLRVA